MEIVITSFSNELYKSWANTWIWTITRSPGEYFPFVLVTVILWICLMPRKKPLNSLWVQKRGSIFSSWWFSVLVEQVQQRLVWSSSLLSGVFSPFTWFVSFFLPESAAFYKTRLKCGSTYQSEGQHTEQYRPEEPPVVVPGLLELLDHVVVVCSLPHFLSS